MAFELLEIPEETQRVLFLCSIQCCVLSSGVCSICCVLCQFMRALTGVLAALQWKKRSHLFDTKTAQIHRIEQGADPCLADSIDDRSSMMI